MKSRLQLVSVAALAMVSAFASASPFIAVSAGTYNTFLGPAYYTTSESIISGLAAPLPVPTSLDFNAPYIDAGNHPLGVTGGVATYKNGTDELKLSFSGGPFSFSSFTSSISGTWSFLSSTGAYSVITGGTGTWSASYSRVSTFSQTTFVGDFEAVPEPASIAVVATGLVGLATRRRRK